MTTHLFHIIGAAIAIIWWLSIIVGLFMEWLDFRHKPPDQW